MKETRPLCLLLPLALFLLGFAGCGGDNPAPDAGYILITTRSPVDGGIVTGGGLIPAGSTATLTAVPAYGYVFSEWRGGPGGSLNPLTLTVDSDLLVTAVFRNILRAVVTLHGTGEVAEVALATREMSAVSSSPLLSPFMAIHSGSGTRGFMISWKEGLLCDIDLASPPAPGAVARDFPAGFSCVPFAMAVKGTKLAVISDDNDFFLRDFGTGAWVDRPGNPNGSGYWDLCANGNGSRFYVADYQAGVRGAVFAYDDTGAIASSLLYAQLGTSIPSTTDGPTALGVSSDGGYLCVANYGSDGDDPDAPDDLVLLPLDGRGDLLPGPVVRVPLADQYTPSRVAKLWDSQGLLVSSGKVYIAGDENGTVARVSMNAETGENTVDVLELDPGADVPPHPIDLVLVGTKLYLTGYDGNYDAGGGNDLLYVVDTTSFAVAQTIAFPAGSHPTSVVVLP